MSTPGSVYEAIGGMPTFRKIVSGFYAQVPDDDILGPMYPEDDMAGAEERLAWFCRSIGAVRRYLMKTAARPGCACVTRSFPSIWQRMTAGWN